MHRAVNQLKEFSEAFRAHTEPLPNIPPGHIRELRKKLIKEEYEEFLVAENAENLVEIADALADLIYVIIGTALAYGIPLDKVFDEVHRSNMTKLGLDGKPILREDGKGLKGPNYKPPQIKRILDAAEGNVSWQLNR